MSGRLLLSGVAWSAVACGDFSFDGRWIGACEGDGVSARVDLSPYLPGDDDSVVRTSGEIHEPDRPQETLYVDCGTHLDGRDVQISTCTGAWGGGSERFDFDLRGTMEMGELVPVLSGTCTIDGEQGTAELWRLP